MRNKKDTLTREGYKKKFDELFSKWYYVPLPGEKIVQCNEGYPPYWFISNKAYVLSVNGDRIKRLKPYVVKTGRKNKDGERTGKKWYVGKQKEPGSGNIDKLYIHQMVAEHFLECELEHNPEDPLEVHHIRKVMTFADDECSSANTVENLQILPKSVHAKATTAGKKTMDLDVEEKIKDSNVPEYQIVSLEAYLVAALQSCMQLNGQAQVMLVNHANSKDPSKIEVSVHPINEVTFVE